MTCASHESQLGKIPFEDSYGTPKWFKSLTYSSLRIGIDEKVLQLSITELGKQRCRNKWLHQHWLQFRSNPNWVLSRSCPKFEIRRIRIWSSSYEYISVFQNLYYVSKHRKYGCVYYWSGKEPIKRITPYVEDVDSYTIHCCQMYFWSSFAFWLGNILAHEIIFE